MSVKLANPADETHFETLVCTGVDVERGVVTYERRESVSFVVPGVPVPWMRAAKQGKRHFTPPRMAAHQERVAYAFNAAAGSSWRPDGMFHVAYEFVLPDWRVVDLDNLRKLPNDALNKLAWVDDSRIMEDPGRKVVDATLPSCTRITITRIGEWPVRRKARQPCRSKL
jgi:Holliday junction resolvase RusA-like endonuclease